MKPIDFIGIKNFRVFDEIEGIFEELSSINLLTGTNNSGKSSIIKYFQMLKNSVAGNKIPFDLDLNEQEHLLGDFENVLNNIDNRNIEIALPFTFLGFTAIYSTLSFEIPSGNESFKGHLRKITITDKSDNTDLFSFCYREATDAEKESYSDNYKLELQEYQNKKNIIPTEDSEKLFLDQFYMPPTDSPLIAYIDWSINTEKLRYFLSTLLGFYEHYLEHKSDENFLDNADNLLEEQSFIASFLIKTLDSDTLVSSWKEFLDSDFKSGTVLSGKEALLEYDFQSDEYFWPEPQIEDILYRESISILNKKLKWKNNTKPDESYFVISECFKSSYKELIGRISSINYLSTVKEENSRIYIGTNNSTFTRLLKDYNSLDIDTHFINRYLKAFEIGEEIVVNFERKQQVITISIKSQLFPERDLVDFGYGIKQLVLLLLHIGVIAKKNKRSQEVYTDEGYYGMKDYYVPSLLLIEEPETNLHPKWQSLLAEMFVEVNELYSIQLIIETHSEYLIRKFQTLTAKGTIKSNEIKIFYLRGAQKITADRKQVEKIFIRSDGMIDYKLFDDGFFDEADNLELSLLNIQRDNFFRDFAAMKDVIDENDNKINSLQQKIDGFTNKADIRVYEALVNAIYVETSKLLPSSLMYLSSAQYLLHNIGDHSDFSPVILQYGRSIENELKGLFVNINPTKKWMFGIMQGPLEKFKSIITTMPSINSTEYASLQLELSNFFNTPMNLKIELLNNLRIKRNEAAHPGPLKTKAEALAYMTLTEEFFKKWIELRK